MLKHFRWNLRNPSRLCLNRPPNCIFLISPLEILSESLCGGFRIRNICLQTLLSNPSFIFWFPLYVVYFMFISCFLWKPFSSLIFLLPPANPARVVSAFKFIKYKQLCWEGSESPRCRLPLWIQLIRWGHFLPENLTYSRSDLPRLLCFIGLTFGEALLGALGKLWKPNTANNSLAPVYFPPSALEERPLSLEIQSKFCSSNNFFWRLFFPFFFLFFLHLSAWRALQSKSIPKSWLGN